jgi:uncharacterized protein YeaO (DUF488 family)
VIKTKRWCDPVEPEDGFRVLVARYRPRGVSREQETWAGWLPQLGPSKALHAAYYGKSGEPISWEEYARRYLQEMEEQTFWVRSLARQHAEGQCVTLLCSSACTDESRCHRTLLRGLMEQSMPPPSATEFTRPMVRRKPA